jgi:hypothetical protein
MRRTRVQENNTVVNCVCLLFHYFIKPTWNREEWHNWLVVERVEVGLCVIILFNYIICCSFLKYLGVLRSRIWDKNALRWDFIFTSFPRVFTFILTVIAQMLFVQWLINHQGGKERNGVLCVKFCKPQNSYVEISTPNKSEYNNISRWFFE